MTTREKYCCCCCCCCCLNAKLVPQPFFYFFLNLCCSFIEKKTLDSRRDREYAKKYRFFYIRNDYLFMQIWGVEKSLFLFLLSQKEENGEKNGLDKNFKNSKHKPRKRLYLRWPFLLESSIARVVTRSPVQYHEGDADHAGFSSGPTLFQFATGNTSRERVAVAPNTPSTP